MDAGFSKSNRLLNAAEFDLTFTTGVKIVSSNLVLYASRHTSAEPRLGLVVSKKVGNSVTRNKVKRLLRESFRRQKPVVAGLNIVAVARAHSARHNNFDKLPLELATGLKRLANSKLKNAPDQ